MDGIVFSSDEAPGIRRQRSGKGFRYVAPDGATLRDKAVLRRVKALAVPPAWTDVWICPDENGHIQATGRDARGRKQYRYHARYREQQDSGKYEHVLHFAALLPRIRAQVAQDMARRGLPREKVVATVVRLLDTTLIRVGNSDYARQNGTYGLTTLRDPHVDVEGAALRFHFKGKSGKTWRLAIHDRRVARIVKACQELPGQHLFQYLDSDGVQHSVTSADVNAYLRAAAGEEDVSAKDFRTWAGTVLAAVTLHEMAAIDGHAVTKKNVRRAIETVAARLGNTATICRKCYVHPHILDTYLEGQLVLNLARRVETTLGERLEHLSAEEAAVMAVLGRGLLNGRAGRRQSHNRPPSSRSSRGRRPHAPHTASR
jgi:DNA topoisomerase-1